MKITSLGSIFLLALVVSQYVGAAELDLPPVPTPQEHRAKFDYRRVQPLLDVPMIDAAITRVADVYYLTGTTGTGRPDGTVNFAVNDGIRLWRSEDLRDWEPLGLVAPLEVVGAKVADLGLLRTAAWKDEMVGLLAPELHRVKGDWYLTYSLRPCGTGLLKSTSGKPEGPYEDVGLITTDGQDASTFLDDDGQVYWVFGGGWIAPMNEDMTALAGRPRLVQPTTPGANTPGAEILQVGTGGAFLFKKDGTYHLLAAGIHGRLGVPCYDTWVATAKSLDGPWSRRKLAVAHGGQATMFEGPDGQWYSTFSGVDSRAAVRERAAIVPVDWTDGFRYFYSRGKPWPWKKDNVITEAWGWEHARPLADLSYRDPTAVSGRDGYYYASGLHNPGSHGRRVELIRGRDLTGDHPWEPSPIPGYETLDKVPWFTEEGGGFLVGICKPFRAAGTFWISLSVRGGKRVLRSESGTMQGPWTVAVSYPDPPPTARIGYWCSHPFQDHRGDMYGYLNSVLWPMGKNFTALDKDRKPPTETGYDAVYDSRLQGYVRQSSDGSHLLRGDAPVGHCYFIDGHYLMMGGCGWHGEYRRFGTYDSEVCWADEVGGPWHPNRSVLPHSGNSGLFQDDDGGWWHVSFCNDSLLPGGGRLRCLPLEIEWNGRGYDIEPKHKQATPYVHHEPAPVAAASAADASPAWPVVTLPPDIRLQYPAVTSVTEAGKTTFYLTGTAGQKQPDGTLDFHNNDGVYLWTSSDLQTWTAVGKVFDLSDLHHRRDMKAAGWNSPFAVYFSPPDSLEPRYDRGVITPKLYRLGGDYYIVCSTGRQQVCLLKSTTGKAEGPYDMVGPEAIHGSTAAILDSGSKGESRTDAYCFAYDPSLFVEDDPSTGSGQGGSVYLVFGPGWIARLQDDPGEGLAERPRLLETEGPQLYAGRGGCRIFKRDGAYHLVARNEWGDLLEYTSDALVGPYGRPRLLTDDGRAGVFADADGALKVITAHGESP